MSAVLKVKVSGDWKTIVEPYVKINGTWKTVHNIWVKHGGTWRLSHKTAFDRYSLIANNSLLNQTSGTIGGGVSGSYTVAAGVRYLQVSMTGGGGQGGGSQRTGGNGLSGGHYVCNSGTPGGPRTTDYAYGSQGGHPGHLNVRFEVIPGETYTWSGGVGGYQGGGNGSPLELNWEAGQGSIAGVGTTADGGNGHSGTALTFTGPKATLSAGGGIGGSPGVVTVSANCTNAVYGATFFGYTVSVTNPSQPGHGANSITADNLVTTNNNGAASGGGGAGSTTFEPGQATGYGSNGSISIWQYGS